MKNKKKTKVKKKSKKTIVKIKKSKKLKIIQNKQEIQKRKSSYPSEEKIEIKK